MAGKGVQNPRLFFRKYFFRKYSLWPLRLLSQDFSKPFTIAFSAKNITKPNQSFKNVFWKYGNKKPPVGTGTFADFWAAEMKKFRTQTFASKHDFLQFPVTPQCPPTTGKLKKYCFKKKKQEKQTNLSKKIPKKWVDFRAFLSIFEDFTKSSKSVLMSGINGRKRLTHSQDPIFA